MSKTITATFLTLTLILTSCSSISVDSKTKNAGKAIAETSCLLFRPDIEIDVVPAMTQEIIDIYGFENSAQIEDYLQEIDGTESQNEIAVVVRTHLEEICGDQIKAVGQNAADVAEAIIFGD